MVEDIILIISDNTIILKKALAINLYSKNFDQLNISKILNLSQPMVSNYLNSKNKIPKKFLNLAEEISEEIIKGNTPFFNTCISFQNYLKEGRCFLANKNELISDEKNKIINNLTEAFLLIKEKDLSGFVPEIKINIAMARENAKNPDDIAAFLNGLIITEEKVTSNNGIRFGKSKHLSSILLYLKEKMQINAIMNIAYNENISNSSYKIGYLTKNFKLQKIQNDIDLLFHKGDFGIEPCIYVLGKDAVDVANKVLILKEELNGIKR